MLGVALQSVAMPHSLAMPLLPDTLANASAEGSVYADDQQVQAYSDYLRAFKECAPAPWVDLNGTSAAEYGRLLNPDFPNLDNLRGSARSGLCVRGWSVDHHARRTSDYPWQRRGLDGVRGEPDGGTAA